MVRRGFGWFMVGRGRWRGLGRVLGGGGGGGWEGAVEVGMTSVHLGVNSAKLRYMINFAD